MKRSLYIFIALPLFIIACKSSTSSLDTDTDCPGGRLGEILFSFEADGEIVSTPAIGDDGTIYFGTQNATLYAVDCKGNLKWQWKYDCESQICPQAFEGSPAIGEDGTIYVGDDIGIPNYLFALSPKGKKKWEYMTIVVYGQMDASPVLLSDGTIFAGAHGQPSSHGLLVALAPDGKVLEGFPFRTDAITASPVVVDDIVVVGETGVSIDVKGPVKRWNSVFAVNKNGDIIWETELDEVRYNFLSPGDLKSISTSLSSIAVDHEKGIFVAQNYFNPDERLAYSNIVQIDHLQGKVLFKMEIPTQSEVVGSPVIDSAMNGANVIVATKNAHIISFNPYQDKGIINFDLDLGENSEASGSPVIGDNGKIYHAINKRSYTDRIDVLEIDKNGVINKDFNVTIPNEHVTSSLAMGKKGVIYFGTKEGRLHAIQSGAKGLSAGAPWPTFRHDTRNTGNSGL